MKQSIIIITNEEQVKSAEYTDYQDIQKAVDGAFEIYAYQNFPARRQTPSMQEHIC